MIKFKNQEEVKLATIEHMINKISKRDPRSNDILTDFSSNYINSFIKSLNEINAPLSNLNDNFIDYYNYLLSHIKKIVANPKNKMITEEIMIDKNKIKRINAKTVNWICQKPGPTVRHKLATVKNIKSTKKIYTLNTKPNQVVKVCIENLLRLLKSRNEVYEKSPSLFNNETLNKEIKELTKLYNLFNNVDSVIHLSPDNTILGNKHYNSIFKSQKKLKNIECNNLSSLDFLLKITQLTIISSKNVEHINQLCKVSDDFNTKMFINSNKTIEEFKVDLNENIIIVSKETYNYDNTWNKINTINYEFIVSKKNNTELNEELYEVEYNSSKIQFYFNLEGVKQFSNFILDNISLNLKEIIEDENKNHILNNNFFSINSYNNSIDNNILVLMNYYTTSEIINSSIYDISEFYLDELITLNDLNHKQYSNYLSKISNNNDIIYDIRDDSDEFSSTIRSNFQNNFSNSFPVWRSILSVESFKDSSIKEVVDLCGKNICVSSIDYDEKEKLFVHNGLMDKKYYLQSEYELLKKYLEFYSDKYSINISAQISHIISSGKLSKLLLNRNDELITFIIDNQYISICFDNEIFQDTIKKINVVDDKQLFVLPDYIYDEIDVTHKIKNSDLTIGANIISEKHKKDKTKPCWYEKLADLSLEVNRDGCYDTLTLIKNEKVLNIIGQSFNFNVDETFTIPAGVSKIRLPLIKTNVYNQNSTNYDAELPSKYFPLEYSIKTVLTMTYSYSNENMYELKFKPISNEYAPFKELIVEWKPRVYSNEIIMPNIIPKLFTDDKIKKFYNDIINFYMYKPYEKYLDKKIQPKDISKLGYLYNDFQSIRYYDPSQAKKIIDEINIDELCNNLLNILEKSKKINYNNIYVSNDLLSHIENFIVSFNPMSHKYFHNNVLENTSNCFGRYFVFAYSNDEINKQYNLNDQSIVLNILESFLLENTSNIPTDSSHKNENVKNISEFFNTFTAATMVNPKILNNFLEENIFVVRQIVDSIPIMLSVYINEMKCFLTQKELTRKPNKLYKDFMYYIRNIIEIIFSSLYLRNSTYFNDLTPSGSTANLIINLLKEVNKYYNLCSEFVERNNICEPIKLKTKYNIIIDNINQSLVKVNPEIYSLILFLSGDKDANYIIIENVVK